MEAGQRALGPAGGLELLAAAVLHEFLPMLGAVGEA